MNAEFFWISYDSEMKEPTMQTVKEIVSEVVQSQPEDATYEEIIKALAFDRMVERGLNDVRVGHVLSNEVMVRKIATWQ